MTLGYHMLLEMVNSIQEDTAEIVRMTFRPTGPEIGVFFIFNIFKTDANLSRQPSPATRLF